MCGIIAIFGNNEPKKRAHLALEKITHRGSNFFELEYFKNGALGANRLPIVDRENGRQPKSNEDKTIFAVLNGEIFNYKELKKQLIEKGHNFSTDSDTEVLVHLYEEFGSKMVNLLDSEMFAFVIYDKRKNSVFAVRDPLGVKPLYYAKDKTGQIYFASELKQLAFFEDIKEIKNIPPGSFYLNGRIKKYFTLRSGEELKREDEIIRLLEKQIVQAIRKRVDTDLPIGVLLSGGVDSSLIMEIATRLHPDVTAIILGYPGSPDHDTALKLCKERKYKYHLVRPEVDYDKELDSLIYHLETYEPVVIRQSFSLDICAREAQRLGLRILLVGDGSDELFGGYNEFSGLPSNLINRGCLMLTESLDQGHFLRLDRMSMKHTVEIRSPFFDKQVVDTALMIDGKLKVKKENHQITTKYIIRKLALNFLPDHIAWRYKVPFSNGAGMNVGNNFKAQDGDVAKSAINKLETEIPEKLLKKFSVNTKEGKYYFSKFDEYGFTKLAGAEKRMIVKDNLYDLHKSRKTRLLVGEFDRLAIYFPVYFAVDQGIFDLHNLDVDFIATGGDDKTFSSLVNNSAHIGLSDPMFAMFENKEGVEGEIIGELVNRVPNVAICLDPGINIKTIDDFQKYRIGTFQSYSTTNGIAKYLLPKGTKIIPLDYKELADKLIQRKIDLAIVLPEQARDLEALGGRIVFEFKDIASPMLFSGFTVANILDQDYRKKLKSFISAVRESSRRIRKNRKEALEVFKKLFPELKQPEKTFEDYLKVWSTTVKVENEDYKTSYNIWKYNYPGLLKNYLPYYKIFSKADPVLDVINSREYRRDFPFMEDIIEHLIIESLENDKPLKFVGFWGASNKSQTDENDFETIARLKSYFSNIETALGKKVQPYWILADEHARSNGYKPQNFKKYLVEIKTEFEKNGQGAVLLSDLWKKWKISPSLIQKEIKSKNIGWWNDVSLAGQLEEQAHERYKLKGNLEGAQKYYVMRMMEKSGLKKDFKNHVFIAFSDGQMQTLYPDMPTVYINTNKRGLNDLPWFNKFN